jgi:predicted small lipoprotein YifL
VAGHSAPGPTLSSTRTRRRSRAHRELEVLCSAIMGSYRRPERMRRLLGTLFVAWALSPSGAGACGLSGPWYVSSDDGYTGIFIIEEVTDDVSCEAQLRAFSPVGESALEACRVLRSDKVVVYCEIISASFFFGPPSNFILDDQGSVLKGRWISDISGNVIFVKQ